MCHLALNSIIFLISSEYACFYCLFIQVSCRLFSPPVCLHYFYHCLLVWFNVFAYLDMPFTSAINWIYFITVRLLCLCMSGCMSGWYTHCARVDVHIVGLCAHVGVGEWPHEWVCTRSSVWVRTCGWMFALLGMYVWVNMWVGVHMRMGEWVDL